MTFRRLCCNFVIPSAYDCLVFPERETRQFVFCSLPKKTGSYYRGSFLTRGISDSLGMLDRQDMVNGVEHAIQVAAIFVVWRLTRVVLHYNLGESCLKLYQANKKQVCTTKNVCFTFYSWLLTNQQYQVRPIKFRLIAIV